MKCKYFLIIKDKCAYIICLHKICSLFRYDLRESGNDMFFTISIILITLKFVFFCNASAARPVAASPM